MRVKERQRYLRLCVHSSSAPLNPRSVFKEVEEWVERLYGRLGLSQASLSLASESPLVVKCSHRCVDMVRAAVAMIDEVDGLECMIHVEAVSGTLRKILKG